MFAVVLNFLFLNFLYYCVKAPRMFLVFPTEGSRLIISGMVVDGLHRAGSGYGEETGCSDSVNANVVFMKCERFWQLEELSASSNGPCCVQLVLLVVGNNTALQNFTMLDNNTDSYVLYHQ